MTELALYQPKRLLMSLKFPKSPHDPSDFLPQFAGDSRAIVRGLERGPAVQITGNRRANTP